MKKRYMLAGSALILLNLTLSACSTKSSSTASKQSSKTVKVVKHKANKKSTNKDKSQSSNKQKSNKASADKQAAKSTDNKQTATTQSQQENQQQVSTNNGQQSSNQSQGNANQQPKTQGQINMERGYDPKGHPIMPGSDHAAGYNPDGTEDSWVKGQDEWLHKNGLINPDGSPTQKEKDMEAQSENDDFGEDIPDEPDPE